MSSVDDPYPDWTLAFEELELEDITPVWEAGRLLAREC